MTRPFYLQQIHMSEQPTEHKHRPIRSFVRREGRLTRGQQRAMDELWPRYGVDTPGVDVLEPKRQAMAIAPLDLDTLFEIGRAHV